MSESQVTGTQAGGETDGVQIVQVIPAELLHVATELLKLFQSNEIGLVGHSNDGGADWYECPCCLAERKVTGYASGTGYIGGVEHQKDCRLHKLHEHVMKLDADNPVWFAE